MRDILGILCLEVYALAKKEELTPKVKHAIITRGLYYSKPLLAIFFLRLISSDFQKERIN
jgi:hypothetical protein